MKRIFILFFLLMLAPVLAIAQVGRSVFPTKNLVTQYVIDSSIDPVNEIIDLPSAGVTARVQLTNRNVNSCTLQAPMSNSGAIYVGGPQVTNSLGVKEGIRINPGEGFGPISIVNSNLLFVSTDSPGNDVKLFCN